MAVTGDSSATGRELTLKKVGVDVAALAPAVLVVGRSPRKLMIFNLFGSSAHLNHGDGNGGVWGLVRCTHFDVCTHCITEALSRLHLDTQRVVGAALFLMESDRIKQ